MLALLSALFLLQAPAASDIESQLRRFTAVYAAVESEAAERIDPDQAVYSGAIPGMLRELDPHSVFLSPDNFDQLKRMQDSVSKGFGSVVSVVPGRVIVLQSLPGTPSAKSGLAAGDEILAVNGIRLDRLDVEQLIEVLTASRQKPASLDVRRPGEARLLQFVLTPEELQAPSVERAFFVRPGVGYIKVTSFDAQTGADIRKAIEKLGGGKLKALILDLRGNPGGAVSAALETVCLFLKPGQTILAVTGRAQQAVQEKVPDTATPYSFPLAVLVDGSSASASEIVAGSLQDHDRAVIVGWSTYGKGLVETVLPLSDNTGLVLTTAFYYTPSGRSIQKPLTGGQIGSVPALSSAREYRTDSGRRVTGGGGIQPDLRVQEKPQTRLQMFLDASGSLTSFAAEYVRTHPGLSESFEVTPQVLDQLQAFLSSRAILPSLAEWSQDRTWVTSRLKTEIFNLAFGVDKGDEVEAQRDPSILAALEALGAD